MLKAYIQLAPTFRTRIHPNTTTVILQRFKEHNVDSMLSTLTHYTLARQTQTAGFSNILICSIMPLLLHILFLHLFLHTFPRLYRATVLCTYLHIYTFLLIAKKFNFNSSMFWTGRLNETDVGSWCIGALSFPGKVQRLVLNTLFIGEIVAVKCRT